VPILPEGPASLFTRKIAAQIRRRDELASSSADEPEPRHLIINTDMKD
jgi:hypothetical protein